MFPRATVPVALDESKPEPIPSLSLTVVLLLVFLVARLLPGAAVCAVLVLHTTGTIRGVPSCCTLEAALLGSDPGVFCH